MNQCCRLRLSHVPCAYVINLVLIFGTVCFLFTITLKTAVLNLVYIFPLKGSSSSEQPSAVDSSCLLHSHGACAASEEPVDATFHLEEQGGIQQDFCQGGNQKQTK